MAEFLLVVEGLAAGGADAAMFVSEDTYKGAMFGCIFAEPVHGYVWCDRHGWVLADEACVCDGCVQEAMEAQIVDEFPYGEFDDGRHWREPAEPPAQGLYDWLTEPCGDPEWTEEDLAAEVAHMDEVQARAELAMERAAEWATQQFISQYCQY
jgi:hypothetical protein